MVAATSKTSSRRARQWLPGSASPVLQAGAAIATGVKPLGRQPFTAPPGYGGSIQSYGQDAMRWNAATGRMEPYTPAPGLGWSWS